VCVWSVECRLFVMAVMLVIFLFGHTNFMIYSRPRYWAQAMLPPPHFNRQLKQDVHHLLWTKEPDFDPTGKGTPTTAKPWINKHAIHNPKRSNNPTSTPQI